MRWRGGRVGVQAGMAEWLGGWVVGWAYLLIYAACLLWPNQLTPKKKTRSKKVSVRSLHVHNCVSSCLINLLSQFRCFAPIECAASTTELYQEIPKVRIDYNKGRDTAGPFQLEAFVSAPSISISTTPKCPCILANVLKRTPGTELILRNGKMRLTLMTR